MIDPTLIKAFRNTRFIVAGPEGQITLRIGEGNRHLDDFLADRGAKSCAFVTAWNPGAIKLPDTENDARQSALIAEVQAQGHTCLPGVGVGADGGWPAEVSILIIGVSRTEAIRLAKRFGQVALVYAERGRDVELLFC